MTVLDMEGLTMKGIRQRLAKYLDDLGVAGVRLEPVPSARRKLPVFIGQVYDFVEARLFGRSFLLLICAGGKRPSPAEAMKQAGICNSRKACFMATS